MKRMFGTLLASLLGLTSLRADFNPATWHSSALDNAGGGTNNWYFFPDATKAPRVLTKSTSAVNATSRKLITGGPPIWTAGAATTTNGINKQGVFVPRSDGGGYLVAPHNTLLKVAIFDNTGGAIVETIDSIAGTYTGISAGITTDNNLHVSYIWNGDNVCYARRNEFGVWTVALSADTNLPIHSTAVIPSSATAANLYFTMTYLSVTSLWLTQPVTVGGVLVVTHNTQSPLVRKEDYVYDSMCGTRVGGFDRLYYFGTNNSATWRLKRRLGDSDGDLQTLGGVLNARSIHVAKGTDGRQRIAWYDANAKAINYLRPTTVADGPPYDVGQPVKLTGTGLAAADLLGFHFSADATPHLLYRRSDTAAFVAFPNDNFDLNGNGRLDLLDTAFNSTTAGLEALPVGPAATGVTNSANRFKIRFPSIGSSSFNGIGAVESTAASGRNLRYSIELSTDGTTWATPTAGTLTFTQTAATGTNPNQVRTQVGMTIANAPGDIPKRFARLAVTRSVYPY